MTPDPLTAQRDEYRRPLSAHPWAHVAALLCLLVLLGVALWAGGGQ